MKLTRNPSVLVGSSVILTTVAFHFASMLTFDRYPLPVKAVLLAGWLVGGTLQIWGLIEQGNCQFTPKKMQRFLGKQRSLTGHAAV